MRLHSPVQGNEQEQEDGTTDDEKYHAACSCRIPHRHSGQFTGDAWLRPVNRILVLGVLGSTRPLPPLCPGLRYTLVDIPPLHQVRSRGTFF